VARSPVARGRSTVGAGVAGATGGTSLLALVNTIPDSSRWKPVLTFASPTIAVAISGLWVFLKTRLEIWGDDRSLDSELKKAEETLKVIESDKSSSDKTTEDARKKMEALDC
jgi:hypothetical protein